MTIPAKVGELLAQGDTSTLPGMLNFDDGCEGAKFHSPNPLIVIDVSIVDPSWPGATTVGDSVRLCNNCVDNLRVYQHLLAQANGQLDWPVRREFGNLIRAIGDKGWVEYTQELEASNA